MSGPYRCIVADPPWHQRGSKGAIHQFPTLRPAEILHVMRTAPCWIPAEDAHLWLWTTDQHLIEALDIMAQLGFRYVRTMQWVKPRQGLGLYLRGQHETCLLGVRGKTTFPDRALSSVVIQPPGGRRLRHSEKWDGTYERIEQTSPGPRLEMFARRQRPGWDVWGNEVETSSETF